MHSGNELPQTLTFPLMMKRMLVTRPHLVSLSPTIRSTVTNIGISAHLTKAWETML